MCETKQRWFLLKVWVSKVQRRWLLCYVLQVQVDEINPRYAALEKEKKLVQQELNNLKRSIETHKVTGPEK